MNKEWAEKKNAEQEKKREEKLMKIRSFSWTHTCLRIRNLMR